MSKLERNIFKKAFNFTSAPRSRSGSEGSLTLEPSSREQSTPSPQERGDTASCSQSPGKGRTFFDFRLGKSNSTSGAGFRRPRSDSATSTESLPGAKTAYDTGSELDTPVTSPAAAAQPKTRAAPSLASTMPARRVSRSSAADTAAGHSSSGSSSASAVRRVVNSMRFTSAAGKNVTPRSVTVSLCAVAVLLQLQQTRLRLRSMLCLNQHSRALANTTNHFICVVLLCM
jgi:hypothetical protein